MSSTESSGVGKVVARRVDAIGWIALDNPARHNAVSLVMWQQLGDAVTAFGSDPTIRVIVLHGVGGKAFASGADISEFAEQRASAEQVETYGLVSKSARRALAVVDKPTIAMIDGFCIGGGLAIALACDLRFAGVGSRFGVPAARLGLGYDAESVRGLMAVVGPAHAKEIFFTARQFSEAEALAMGLVNRVFDRDALEREVRNTAARIAVNAPLTVTSIKTIVGELQQDESQRDMALCDAVVKRCFASADYREGREAFMARREPQFTGR